MNILLIYGGKSCEHDISIITACLAKQYFLHNLICVYLDKDNKAYLTPVEWSPQQHKNYKKKLRQVVFKTGSRAIFVKGAFNRLKKINIDYGVNCCHGINGEDGAVSALLQMCNITEVESTVLSCGVAMDKVLTKLCLKGLELPVVKGVAVEKQAYTQGSWKEIVSPLGFPVIVKPATLGSSIGITVAHDSIQLADAMELAFHFDTRVLVEVALNNFYELNCAVLSDGSKSIVSHVEKPHTDNDLLTFDDKYIGGSIKTPCVNQIVSGPIADTVKMYTEKIYKNLGMRGVVRVDYLVADDKVYVNEINTVPGSLAYGLFQDIFTEQEFGEALLKQASALQKQRDSVQYNYLSSVLDNTNFAKK